MNFVRSIAIQAVQQQLFYTCMCKVFPSNRKKLKKRKCDLHEINSASPMAVFLNMGSFHWANIRSQEKCIAEIYSLSAKVNL